MRGWLAIAITVLLALPAVAQQAPQADVVRQTCAAEFPKVCPGVQTGGPAALQCLLQNTAKLSPTCRDAVAATQRPATAPAASPPPPPAAPSREEVVMMRDNCGADYQKFCPGVPFGGGRIINCLNQHEGQLSATCKSALAGLRR